MWDYETPLYDIMEGLNNIVKAGKVRYIGISNCFAYQFVSVQGHYNLIFREEEREMAKLSAEDNIAMTPYSALAGGRLAKRPGETSKRLEEDNYAKGKVVGATKLYHMEGAAKAVELALSEEEYAYLEEAYVPHALVGVMAQNTRAAAKEKHVWGTGNHKI